MYTLRTTQRIPISLDEAWAYFSSPGNLNEITPKDMGFHILGEVPKVMYQGMFINYKVTPILGIKMDWTTEITHVVDRSFFVDEQRVGPYKIWHHEHHFKEIDGGVEMTDIVSYALPFGWIGKLAHPLLVKKKLNSIFEFRFHAVQRIFGPFKNAEA